MKEFLDVSLQEIIQLQGLSVVSTHAMDVPDEVFSQQELICVSKEPRLILTK